MFKLLLRLVTCNKNFKKDSRKRGINTPLPIDDSRQEDYQDHIGKDAEMYGYSKIGGGSGKTECQDAYSILQKITPSSHFFAVYDGHGVKGKDVAQFVNESIAQIMRENAENMGKLVRNDSIGTFFKTTFGLVERKLIQSSISITYSGTCCISALISKGKLYIANLGDSRAVLCKQEENGDVIVEELTQDHKPTREDEKERVIQMGGLIEPMYYNGMAVGPLRVWTKAKDSGLAMTRAMGDVRGKKAGLISEPEIHKVDLQPNDKFIIMASDGLWDVMSSEEAASFVLEYEQGRKDKSQVAKALVKEAKKKWAKLEEFEDDPYCDDITAIVIFTNYQAPDVIEESETKPASLEDNKMLSD
jgi:serine/threonine protein phosphatase PrpC